MIIHHETKTIQIKLVYYGCAMSGKTTSLRKLFQYFALENSLTSIETTTGRTLFFDYGIVNLDSKQWHIKLNIYSATGQDFYASTRPSTLSGTDGIIFVIDSQQEFLQDNLRSWKELQGYYRNKITKIPIVFCLNKQDLENVIGIQQIIDYFEIRNFPRANIVKTSALNGEGILFAFKNMLQFLFPLVQVS